MAAINPFVQVKRIILKIGSALLVTPETGQLKQAWLTALCSEIAQLRQDGIQVVVVSSGAIALGRARLGLLGRDLTLPEKQACAAAGQSLLTQAYERGLAAHEIIGAQALLTLTDTEDRRRWINARGALTTLLNLGAIPVINENDTVATDEIRYGDNDRLAARAAQMLGADTLILLSDIDGLYTSDPRKDEMATHIPIVEDITPEIIDMGGSANAASNVGTGGMATKLAAAEIAVLAGCHMCILDGSAPSPLARLMSGANCTWFKAEANPMDAKRQWIKSSLTPNGSLLIDDGAAKALHSGKSLLTAGVKNVSGVFRKGDALRVTGPTGEDIARGLANYDALDAEKIIGLKSGDIMQKLGYTNGPALIHRDNLVLIS